MSEKYYNFCDLTKRIKVKDAILEKYIELGEEKSILGYPVSPEYPLRFNGAVQVFQYGNIYFHPEYKAAFTNGKICRYWQDFLGVHGKYQYPVSDIKEAGGVFTQEFEGGVLSTDMPELKNKSDLTGELGRRGVFMRNQGARGTCSIHVMVALLDYMYSGLLGKDFANLSIEYSNYFASVAAGNANDGDFFSSVEKGYEEYGIVPESAWAYDANFKYSLEACADRSTQALINYGRMFISDKTRLNGYFIKQWGAAGLSDEQFDKIIAYLDGGIPLGVGRDHSMTLVAYEKDEKFDGGGIFTFKNSYGSNAHFTGYQTETFENVKKTVLDVYVYTGFKNK